MSWTFRALLLGLTLVSITGCSYNGANLKSTNDDIVAVDGEINEDTRRFVTAADDALQALPDEKKTPESELAQAMTGRAQEIMGLPQYGTRIDVNSLLSENVKVRARAYKVLAEQDARIVELIREKQKLQGEVDKYASKLIELGKVKEQEQNSNIIKRIWTWGLATFGIGGLIAIAVFCPFLLPILGQLLSYVISSAPQILNLFGVVGKSVASNLVKGIGEVRNTIQSAPADKTYTKAEIQALLDGELKSALDAGDKKVIQHLRDTLNV